MRRYDAHASEKTHEGVLRDLADGKKIALVSDAGTPGISDPGVMLVARARAKGARIDAIPGASAVTTAFSIAGISGNSFIFLGFVPLKKGRQTFFKNLSAHDIPIIFYEAPHRIMKTLESLTQNLSIDRKVVVARELTKMYEEVITGTSEEVLQYFLDHSDHVRGEFVVLID